MENAETLKDELKDQKRSNEKLFSLLLSIQGALDEPDSRIETAITESKRTAEVLHETERMLISKDSQ